MEWEKQEARQTHQIKTQTMHLHAWFSSIITASSLFIYLISSRNDDAEHASLPTVY